jgi:hypothetical protein
VVELALLDLQVVVVLTQQLQLLHRQEPIQYSQAVAVVLVQQDVLLV